MIGRVDSKTSRRKSLIGICNGNRIIVGTIIAARLLLNEFGQGGSQAMRIETGALPMSTCSRISFTERCVVSGFRSFFYLAVAVQTATTFAGTLVSVDFASGYSNGALVGQNSWLQTSTITTSPIQVTSGSAIVGTSGQDIYKAFTQSESLVAGNYLLTRIDFFPTAVQATGDYFFHVSDPASTTTNFYQRFFARQVSGSVQLGLSTNSSGIYGSGLLPLNQSITAVMKWNFITGANNDTIDLFVNPADPANPSGSPYVSATWSTAEPASLAAVNLRQGTAGNAPSLRVSSMQVEVVPEPGTIALLGVVVGGIGILVCADGDRHRVSFARTASTHRFVVAAGGLDRHAITANCGRGGGDRG